MQYFSKIKKNRILKVVVFVALLIILNKIVRTFVEPLETASEVMLTEYSKRTIETGMDTIIIGNSVTSMIDDEEFSNITGTKTFNMGTPAQSIGMSLDALKMAARQNEITTVILMTGYESLDADTTNIPERAYEKVVFSSYPVIKRIGARFATILGRAISPDNWKKPSSINMFFMWIDNCVDDPNSMWINFKTKVTRVLTGNPLGKNIAFSLDQKKYETRVNTRTEEDVRLFRKDIDYLRTIEIPEEAICDVTLEELDEISVFCRDNNIKLYYFISPHQSQYVDKYGESFDVISKFIEQFMTERSFVYYNFESDPLIHQELPDNYFDDYEHVTSVDVKYSTEVVANAFLCLSE